MQSAIAQVAILVSRAILILFAIAGILPGGAETFLAAVADGAWIAIIAGGLVEIVGTKPVLADIIGAQIFIVTIDLTTVLTPFIGIPVAVVIEAVATKFGGQFSTPSTGIELLWIFDAIAIAANFTCAAFALCNTLLRAKASRTSQQKKTGQARPQDCRLHFHFLSKSSLYLK